MNKIDCDIARDLMPLVIDDVASPAAKEAVGAHLEGCAECRQVMTALRREPAAPPAETDTKFIRFCRKMERGLRWQRLRWEIGRAHV